MSIAIAADESRPGGAERSSVAARRALFWPFLLGILLLGIGRSWITTRWDGFTIDEAWHAAAGASYARSGDYRLNPEHPPLVKLWVGTALLQGGFRLAEFRPMPDKEGEREFINEAIYRLNDADVVQQRVRVAMLGCTEPEIVGPNGRCFVVTSTPLSWSDARLECQSRGPGWDLASIRDDAVNQFMGALNAGEAWIGASDAQNEGIWVWVGDGTPFWRGSGAAGSAVPAAYENWNSDEPNGGANSDCSRLVFTTIAAPNPPPAWADLECFELRRSVCDGPPL
jgi:hypothetical protein